MFKQLAALALLPWLWLCPAQAQTTWDPSAHNAGVTLGHGNLAFVTNTGNGTWKSLLATSSHSTGKYCWEMSSSVNNDGNLFMGFGNASANLSSYPGSDANSLGVDGASGFFYGPSVSVQAFGTRGVHRTCKHALS